MEGSGNRGGVRVHGSHGGPRNGSAASDDDCGGGRRRRVHGRRWRRARFNKPIRLAPFGPDAVLVADIYNHAIRSVSKDGRVRTIAGAPDRKGHEDGPAATARFASPHGVATAAGGLIAVAEAEGHTLRLLTPKTDAAGGYEVSTLAGTPGKSGGADGPARQALFNSPHAALWGEDGALYTPDIGNATIRRVRNGMVEAVAGAGGDKLVYPIDIAWLSRRRDDRRRCRSEPAAHVAPGRTARHPGCAGPSRRRTAWPRARWHGLRRRHEVAARAGDRRRGPGHDDRRSRGPGGR